MRAISLFSGAGVVRCLAVAFAISAVWLLFLFVLDEIAAARRRKIPKAVI